MSLKGFEAERRAAIDRQLLLDVLKAAPGRRFSASELRSYTAGKSTLRPRGVPKSVVRRRLEDVGGVSLSNDVGGFRFSWAS
jgi:hypothetical protein